MPGTYQNTVDLYIALLGTTGCADYTLLYNIDHSTHFLNLLYKHVPNMPGPNHFLCYSFSKNCIQCS